MGCDIHAHIEIRYNGKWEHYAMPSIDRNYQLFEKMAGVRGREENAIVKPKGIPADLSIVTRLDYERWGVDAHSASWFNEDEIDKLDEWLDTKRKSEDGYGMRFDLEYGILNRTYMFGDSLTAFKHYNDVEYVPDGVDAVRLVFWFDN